jgi:hypothetical protein
MNAMLSNIQVPSRESLIRERFFKVDDLDPKTDNWDGWLACDEMGPYTFAREVFKYDLSVYKGKKIYISEYYDQLEEKIIDCYEEAVFEMGKLQYASGVSSLQCVMSLLKIEATLVVLKHLHNYPPIGMRFLTGEELETVLAEEAQLDRYVEYLSLINFRKDTPLGIGTMLQKTFCQNKISQIAVPISHLVLKSMTVNKELN